MDSFIYSLNATVPVFLVILIGYFLKRIHMLDSAFVKTANKFNFKVTLPALLFVDLSTTDILANFDVKYVLYCALVTLASIAVLWIAAKFFIKDKSIIGEFVQAGYRSSAAVLGVAFIQNIYGSSGMAPVMIIGCVPLFNIFAVLILTFENGGDSHKGSIKNALLNIAKNPIIIGILLGLAASVIKLNLPNIVDKALDMIAKISTPLALIAIGAGFEGKAAIEKIKPTAVVSFVKLIVLPAVFLPVAIALGFRNQELIAIIIMLGSPTTPSAYIMSKNMGHEGVLSSSAIVSTTFISSLTLTFWIFIARYMGFIV